MKRIIIGLALVTTLAGCATVQNPITRAQLSDIEAGYGIALSFAAAYKRLPLCHTGTVASVSSPCAQRSVIVRMQQADRSAHAAMVAARVFIRDNPQLDATSVI